MQNNNRNAASVTAADYHKSTDGKVEAQVVDDVHQLELVDEKLGAFTLASVNDCMNSRRSALPVSERCMTLLCALYKVFRLAPAMVLRTSLCCT